MKRGGLASHIYVMTVDEAALLEKAGLDRLRMNVRGVDERVDRILLDIRRLALSSSAFVDDLRFDQKAKAATRSEQWITPTQAAHELGISAVAVRQAAREKRVQGENIEGRWRILHEDIRIWKAARAA